MITLKSILILLVLLTTQVYSATIKEELLSPITTEAVTPVFAGSSISLGLIILEDQIVDPVQDDTAEDKPLGEYAELGDLMGQMVPNALYAGGMFVHQLFTDDEQSKSNYILMLKATAYAGGLTTLLKPIVKERRPNGQSRLSFPSGHSTIAFAFAAVVGARHNIYWGTAAYLMATLVAYSRMNDNAHYIHDVTAGATIGIGYGLGLHYLEKNEKKDKSYSLIPIATENAIGLTWTKRF
ncbi:MAG: phosphatase PAP2 family protein [Halobacteriovoraceae bacterium]|nr:phosphatase PAP2 family protein [Halobacteriovoraceae bacterium]